MKTAVAFAAIGFAVAGLAAPAPIPPPLTVNPDGSVSKAIPKPHPHGNEPDVAPPVDLNKAPAAEGTEEPTKVLMIPPPPTRNPDGSLSTPKVPPLLHRLMPPVENIPPAARTPVPAALRLRRNWWPFMNKPGEPGKTFADVEYEAAHIGPDGFPTSESTLAEEMEKARQANKEADEKANKKAKEPQPYFKEADASENGYFSRPFNPKYNEKHEPRGDADAAADAAAAVAKRTAPPAYKVHEEAAAAAALAKFTEKVAENEAIAAIPSDYGGDDDNLAARENAPWPIHGGYGPVNSEQDYDGPIVVKPPPKTNPVGFDHRLPHHNNPRDATWPEKGGHGPVEQQHGPVYPPGGGHGPADPPQHNRRDERWTGKISNAVVDFVAAAGPDGKHHDKPPTNIDGFDHRPIPTVVGKPPHDARDETVEAAFKDKDQALPPTANHHYSPPNTSKEPMFSEVSHAFPAEAPAEAAAEAEAPVETVAAAPAVEKR
ncbi:hypothetical protein Sste5346_001467 [Sporothrix stenoceras]|uniref:Uncharacterized protein n=1 Tax=Sporothrix stenoceras TaxID=5173 RepID=A0ABR3ZQT7_9PEZI